MIRIEIHQQTGFEGAELKIVDLENFDSVNALGDTFEKEGLRLVLFVYNAAIGPVVSYAATKDGWERT